MSVIDRLLENNHRIAEELGPDDLPVRPALGVAIVSCMDSRILVTEMLGIKRGDAHIIRNAGACVNDETMRSLFISTWRMQTRDILIVSHTDCGLHNMEESAFISEVQGAKHTTMHPGSLNSFQDLDGHVAAQVMKARVYPLMPEGVTVRGFVYDVHSRLMREIDVPRG